MKILRNTGFTIVELLIVIVVIAILATIALVAYNGIQQRASNAQMISAVNTYYKALMNVYAEDGAYPSGSYWAACLGSGYPEDRCWTGPDGTYNVSSSLDAILQDKGMLGGKPSVPTKTYRVTSGGGVNVNHRSGILYYDNEPSGRHSIEYALDGINQDCSMEGAVAVNQGGTASARISTKCTIILPEAS